MRPSRDPNIPHPGRIFYGGAWLTPEQVEAKRKINAKASKKYRETYPEKRFLTVLDQYIKLKKRRLERGRKHEATSG